MPDEFVEGSAHMKFTACSCVVGLAIMWSSAASAQSVAIGTSNPGSIYHSSGSAIAKVANEKAGLRATIQPYASPNVFIPAVNAGELEFGLANVFETSLALEGKDHFDGRPHRELRAVAIMWPLRTGFFVKKDSPIKTIADLKGKTLPDGYTSQKISLPILDAIYATGGLTRADMRPAQVPNVVGGANEFIAGKADGFFFALGSAKVSEADAAVGGIRALPMADDAPTLAAIKRHLPLAYIRAERPGPNNPGVLEPINVIAYDALIFASAKTKDDIVYKVVKAMHENKADMAATFGVFNLFDPGAMAKTIDPIAYHPGAIKFYTEKGMWPPK